MVALCPWIESGRECQLLVGMILQVDLNAIFSIYLRLIEER